MRKRESEREKETYGKGISNWNYIQSISKNNMMILIIDNLSQLEKSSRMDGSITTYNFFLYYEILKN